MQVKSSLRVAENGRDERVWSLVGYSSLSAKVQYSIDRQKWTLHLSLSLSNVECYAAISTTSNQLIY